MRKEHRYLTKRLEEMDAVIDRQEQYSRRNCLLNNGVDEVAGEDPKECSIKVIEENVNPKINLETLIGHIDLESQKNL